MFKWLFKKKGCAKHMNNKLEVIGIDHGWSMMKTISQVFVTGVKEITTLRHFSAMYLSMKESFTRSEL